MKVNGSSSYRPPRLLRSLLTMKQMLYGCNPLSTTGPKLYPSGHILWHKNGSSSDYKFSGTSHKTTNFSSSSITMSIVFAVWESMQVTMKLTMQRILASIRRHLDGGEGWQQLSGDVETQEFPREAEPASLRRSSQTGGCRLPELASVAETWKTHQDTDNRCETYEVDNSTSKNLAADLVRPFGQSTGRGFSFTRFKIDGSYKTLIMRQQDVFAPYMGPGHTVTPQTLYEIGHVITHADPICGHLWWSEEYPFLIPHIASVGLDYKFSDDDPRQVTDFSLPITSLNGQNIPQLAASAQIQKRLRCALFHAAHCMCADSVPFGAVRSCPRCHTDYAVSIVPDAVPGWPEARLFVFTTWKFLGEGIAQDIYWSSHITSAPPRREYGLGYMHLYFESRPRQDYIYNINIEDTQARVALARLTRRDVPPA